VREQSGNMAPFNESASLRERKAPFAIGAEMKEKIGTM
jgi:hypothetical protein